MKLSDLAYSHTSNQGNILNIAVTTFDPRHYDLIAEYITSERVGTALAGIVSGEVARHERLNLGALDFAIHQAPGAGAVHSSALDAASSAILELDFPECDY
jgi:hypothetical protein